LTPNTKRFEQDSPTIPPTVSSAEREGSPQIIPRLRQASLIESYPAQMIQERAPVRHGELVHRCVGVLDVVEDRVA
jgi:hypothetical protein